MVKENQEQNDKRNFESKKHNKKSYSWNAGYYTKAAAAAKRQYEYHTSKAIYCKSKSKEVKAYVDIIK